MKIESATTVIIPAAGFGRRVGSPPAKELLTRPGTNEPYIVLPIRVTRALGYEPLVITRRDKHILVDYMLNKHPDVQLHLIESSSDWPDTILQSEAFWTRKNLVLLPDTEFAPIEILSDLAKDLDAVDVVAAVHQVEDNENWGHLWKYGKDRVGGCEKPKQGEVPSHSAWGIFGFQRDFGCELLTCQQWSQANQSHFTMNGSFRSRQLDEFFDLTR